MPVAKLPQTILSLVRLSLQRDETHILRNVSWRISRGEHWVILGSNGSGKTSLLKVLTGYMMASRGEIELLGERFGDADWRTLRERVGLVSSAVRQRIPDRDTALDVVISGRRAMIGFWGKAEKEEIRRARSLLRRLDCSRLLEREWGVLSQGERQRVLIARALMADPALLILDEPCAGLDPVARERFLASVQRLAEESSGPALVLVTHHVEEIVPAITHALLLRGGRVVTAGPKKAALVDGNVKATFGHCVRLSHRSGRYQLKVSTGA